jgi:hypothetical protein
MKIINYVEKKEMDITEEQNNSKSSTNSDEEDSETELETTR